MRKLIYAVAVLAILVGCGEQTNGSTSKRNKETTSEIHPCAYCGREYDTASDAANCHCGQEEDY